LLPRRNHQLLSSIHIDFHYSSSFTQDTLSLQLLSANMKFSAALVALVSGLGAVAAPIEDAAQPLSIEKRNPGGIDYNQNYNGGAAGYQSNLSTGKYSLKWNSGTDVVAGLGWKTGSPRAITYSGQYSPGNSGSYLAVYGWINNPQAEYYIVGLPQSFLPSKSCPF
jgi:endo-1,4-beta-xylanase